jgi:phosphoribosylformylglycinamidine synthase subunit PurQ / glutaminase
MPRVAVVRFPGSNCDFDTLRAAERSGGEAYFVWHRDVDLRGADIVILPATAIISDRDPSLGSAR